MSSNEQDDDAKLEALDLFVINQLLNATDDEILDQAEPGDSEKVEEAFRKAKVVAGKTRMANARAAVAEAKVASVVPFDPLRMRQRLDGLVSRRVNMDNA